MRLSQALSIMRKHANAVAILNNDWSEEGLHLISDEHCRLHWISGKGANGHADVHYLRNLPPEDWAVYEKGDKTKPLT